MVFIAVCGGLVLANNAGLIPERWRDALVLRPAETATAELPEEPAIEPEPEPAPEPEPERKPITLPKLPVPKVQRPASLDPRKDVEEPEPEPSVEPTPEREPEPEKPAPRPVPELKTKKKPAAKPKPAAAGVLTPAERRDRLVDVVPPDGFTSEWRGGPALLSIAANEIALGRPEPRRVALTMDGCYEADQIPAILELLQANRVKATFFLTGIFAEKFPDSVRKIAGAGHEIAHHSYDHPAFTKLSDDKILAQMHRTERLLLPLAGRRYKPYWRPPYGDRDVRVLRLLLREGYLPVYWTADTLDWQKEATAESVLARVEAKGMEPGAILLTHVAAKPTLRALPRLIERLRAADLEPGPLSGVLSR